MTDEDVESYVDSIVEKKLKKLGVAGGEVDEGGSLIPKQIKEFKGAISMVKELGDATRGDLDKIISEGIREKMAEQIVPALFGGQKSVGFMDSGFMQQLGRGLGEKIPEYGSIIIDSLTKNFGKDNAEKMIDKVMGSGGNFGSDGGSKGKGGKKDENEDTIRSLDPDNPNHLHYYMSIKGLSNVSIDDARKSLITEKTNLMEKEKMKSGGSEGREESGKRGESGETRNESAHQFSDYDGSDKTGDKTGVLEKAIIEQNSYLEKMIKRQNQSDEVIKFLVEKMEKMEGKKRGVDDGVDIMERDIGGDIKKEDVEAGSVGEENTGEKSKDVIIVDKISNSWEKDIEKNKEMIRKKNEEEKIKREEEKRLKREKEERERVVVMGKKRTRSNPVFENIVENATENNTDNNIETEANI